MMGGLWAKVVVAMAMIIGMMGAALLYVGGQKDRAREAASEPELKQRARAR